MVKSRRQGNRVPSITSEHISLQAKMGEEERWPCFKVYMKNFARSRDRWSYIIYSMHIPDWKNISRRQRTDGQDHQRSWTITELFLSFWRTFFLSHHINQINHIQTLLLISLEEITMILSWDLGVCFYTTYTKEQDSYMDMIRIFLVDLRMQRLFVSTSLKDHNDDYKKRRYWKDFIINKSRDQNFLFWKKYGMLH